MQSALASLDTPATCSLDEIAREQNRTLPAPLYRHLENWQKVRRGENAPSLSDLFNESDPVTQPWLVVIDTEHEDKQPIRLIGTAVADFFGFDATGYDFLQSVAPPLREYSSTRTAPSRTASWGNFIWRFARPRRGESLKSLRSRFHTNGKTTCLALLGFSSLAPTADMEKPARRSAPSLSSAGSHCRAFCRALKF